MRVLLRILLIGLAGIVAITALPSAFLVVPTMPLEWIKAGPFTDWTVPAIALFVVGALQAVALVALAVRPWAGAIVSVVAGAAIVVFELVEIGVVGWTLSEFSPDQAQAWLQLVYLVIGGLQIIAGTVFWLLTRDSAPALPLIHEGASG